MKLRIVAMLTGAVLLQTAAAAERNDEWSSARNGNAPMITGSGHIVTQPRAITDFSGIDTDGIGNIYVRFGPQPSLAVVTDDNLLQHLTTRVTKGVLHVGSVGSFRTRIAPVIYVTIPNLTSAITSGSGSIILKGINNRELKLIARGSGNIIADGHTDRLGVEVQGSGSAELRSLQARSAKVDVYGSGNAWVGTNGTLIAQSFGSGDVFVIGHPASLSVSEGGSGRVIVHRG